MASLSLDELFWRDTQRWPVDGADCIFLARAVMQIEQRLYEYPLIAPPPWDDVDDDSESAKLFAELQYEKEKIARLSKAVDVFVSACRDGILSCATRPKRGGKFSDLNQSIWNTEHYFHWFYKCEIDEASPYDADTEWADTKWIFVQREGLENLRLPLVPIPSQPRSGYLSPYLALMIEVSEELKISSTNQPTIEELKALFNERWEKLGRGNLSGRLVHGMATLVRNPESQGGRNKTGT